MPVFLINKVPTHVCTMVLKTIMQSKEILLMASGVNKAEAIKALVNGKVSVDLPASILKNHANVVVICDKAAASLI